MVSIRIVADYGRITYQTVIRLRGTTKIRIQLKPLLVIPLFWLLNEYILKINPFSILYKAHYLLL